MTAGASLFDRRCLAYLGAGSAAILTYYLLPSAGVAQPVVMCSMNAAGAVLTFWAVRKAHGRTARIWLWLALAMTVFTLANTTSYGYPLFTGRPLPFPCPTDVLFLGAYACFAVALAAMAGQRRRAGRRGDTLDATIVIIGGGLVMWNYVISPVVVTSMPALAHTVAVAYPSGDLVVFAFLARFLLGKSRRNRSSQLLLGSFIALLAADMLYADQLADGTYHFGGPTDSLWMLSYLLIGVAALHPSASSLGADESSAGPRLSRGRVIFLCVAVLTGPMVVVFHTGQPDIAAAASGVLFLLVMCRVTSLNHQLISAMELTRLRGHSDLEHGAQGRSALWGVQRSIRRSSASLR